MSNTTAKLPITFDGWLNCFRLGFEQFQKVLHDAGNVIIISIPLTAIETNIRRRFRDR
ncbi:hypothetical protein H6G96_29080 [Nostoc sp. FACHB-892]|uniref:hypothetical protein n=1 Tax=Nostoc sp. FACHB-892 TaxID=2692843 RepID=UPI001686CFCA|nr:hypothetical protein [Nostoc sp. FACHB-892]MBD2730260.1 hypothetical protein [Nostoc sp. FACHB-892]